MIKKICYGQPYDTMAVVKKIEAVKDLLYFGFSQDKNDLTFEYTLNSEDAVYGLGETMCGINKRGCRLISFNTDDTKHTKETLSLYSSHNFIIVDGKEHFGAFFDTPAKTIFEIDYQNSGKIRVQCATPNLALYIITGSSAYDITKQFLDLIGQSFIPPLWAFGFGQSKWGYKTQADFETVIENYRKNHLPLDYVCMDIDYMDRYIDFSINKERFPDMKAFVESAKKQNVHLVPIIDAGIKVEPGNKVYDEGVKNNYFCKDKDGNNYSGLVWPGQSHFTDFWQPKARKWFGQQYKVLTDLGFEGFWNDMNEPSLFAKEFNVTNFKENSSSQENAEGDQKVDDYKIFYHKINGENVCHYDVHNAYGHLMTMAAGEELKTLVNHRYLLFTRSTYIGSHRYGGLWTGDNMSLWEHLKQNVLQMPSLSMCGFLYAGADTGGFTGDCTKELLLRWLAFSTFTPLMRVHSAITAIPQECYSFGSIKKFRGMLSLRYKLLPYIYSEYVKAALRKDMLIKPLAFEFDDPLVKNIEDQLLVGESIMVAPIVEKGQNARTVYLPEMMTKVKYNGKTFKTSTLAKGFHTIAYKPHEVVFFIRNDKLVPVSSGAESTSELNLADVTLLGNGTTYEQYLDDGLTKDVTLKNIKILTQTQRP